MAPGPGHVAQKLSSGCTRTHWRSLGSRLGERRRAFAPPRRCGRGRMRRPSPRTPRAPRQRAARPPRSAGRARRSWPPPGPRQPRRVLRGPRPGSPRHRRPWGARGCRPSGGRESIPRPWRVRPRPSQAHRRTSPAQSARSGCPTSSNDRGRRAPRCVEGQAAVRLYLTGGEYTVVDCTLEHRRDATIR